MKKKLASLFLIVIFIFTCIGCNNTTITNDNSSSSTPTDTSNDNNSNNKPDVNTDNSNTSSNNNPSNNTDKEQPEQSKPKIETKTCRLFFYNIDNDTMYYVDKSVTIEDGALVKALSNAHKNSKDGDSLVKLHSEALVTSAKLKGDTLEIYFNKDFQSKMNLGSGAECGLIDSLVNTYGYNFNVKKVAIYSDNQLFTGVRGSNSTGYYTVDYSKAKPLK